MILIAEPEWKSWPDSTPAATRSSAAVFRAVHQYGGVALGEHLGQFLTILWMSMISGILYESKMFGTWVAWLGWFDSVVYLLAQTELLATAIPGFRVIGWAGLCGSLLWLAWMLVLGIYLVKYK